MLILEKQATSITNRLMERAVTLFIMHQTGTEILFLHPNYLFLKGKQQGKPLLWYIYIYDKRVERVKKKQPSRIYRGEEKRGWIYKKN
jgi:hypothetical protein